MHACFHGGAKITKSINAIRDFTKILMGGGGSYGRPRRSRPEADGRRRKDTAAASPASAKIAPAQLQEEGDGDRHCDKCCSAVLEAGGAEEEAAEECYREWVAEPEPGVLLTLAPRPGGTTNRLLRIRFREELFDAWAAQCWWADNYDRVVELYSVVQSDGGDDEEGESAGESVLPSTPCQSQEEEEDSRSPSTSNLSGGPSSGSGGESAGTLGSPILGVITTPTTSGAAAPAAGAAEAEQDGAGVHGQQTTAPWREWAEEYEPGVFVTVRACPGHRLQLQRVELSRERFGEVKAMVWWQENKHRLQNLYSF